MPKRQGASTVRSPPTRRAEGLAPSRFSHGRSAGDSFEPDDQNKQVVLKVNDPWAICASVATMVPSNDASRDWLLSAFSSRHVPSSNVNLPFCRVVGPDAVHTPSTVVVPSGVSVQTSP